MARSIQVPPVAHSRGCSLLDLYLCRSPVEIRVPSCSCVTSILIPTPVKVGERSRTLQTSNERFQACLKTLLNALEQGSRLQNCRGS
jgi:hypothetical protein